MKRLMKCRVNGLVFLAFVFLYFAVLAICASWAVFILVDSGYSSFISLDEDENGENTATYSYTVDEKQYVYSVATATETPILVPQNERIFYFKDYPDVRTDPFITLINPILIMVMGAAFSLTFRVSQHHLYDDSSRFGSYIIPSIISLITLIPSGKSAFNACDFVISAHASEETTRSAVTSMSFILLIVGVNLLMWGIWAKVIESRAKKRKNSESTL